MHGLLHVGPIEEAWHNLQCLVYTKVPSKGSVMMLLEDGGEDGMSTWRDAKPWVGVRRHQLDWHCLVRHHDDSFRNEPVQCHWTQWATPRHGAAAVSRAPGLKRRWISVFESSTNLREFAWSATAHRTAWASYCYTTAAWLRGGRCSASESALDSAIKACQACEFRTISSEGSSSLVGPGLLVVCSCTHWIW